ncbi:MAG: recombination protein RecR [Elusimicrobia bacterium]|nr:recombination protein RecR [Elusimicrobiota bacterium]
MKSFERLVSSLRRLPGIGPKQAERLALHLLRAPASETETLGAAMREARARVRACSVCLDYTEGDTCRLCSDPGRDRSLVCVVEQPTDVAAVERSRSFGGLYHVLHGRLAPLHGAGPEALRTPELEARLKGGGVTEVILATDSDTEGEATALWLAELLKPYPVRLTRLAQGVPLGGHLDYLDEQTVSCAVKARRDYGGGR